MNKTGLIAFALGIGILTVGMSVIVPMMIRGVWVSMNDEWEILAVNILIAALPFLILGLAGIQQRAPWLVGLALTWLLWGYYTADPYLRSGGGANIGLGLLMLVSPLPITLVSLLFRRRVKA